MRISDWSSDVCSSDLGVQPVGDLPIVLREDRPGRALERRRGVVDVAGGGEIALGTDRLTQGELLRRRVGFPPIRQQAFAQRVDVLEIERAGRILDEQVEQVDAVHLDPGLELMRALAELCDGAIGIDAGAQVVRGAREARRSEETTSELQSL